MSRNKEVSLDFNFTIRFKYDPGYPAPACSNHDSPAFSNPGCGPEIDNVEIDPDGELPKCLRDALIKATEDQPAFDEYLIKQAQEQLEGCDDVSDPDEEYDSLCDRELDDKESDLDEP